MNSIARTIQRELKRRERAGLRFPLYIVVPQDLDMGSYVFGNFIIPLHCSTKYNEVLFAYTTE